MKLKYLFLLCVLIQFPVKSQTKVKWTHTKNISIFAGRLIKNGDVKKWWNAGTASKEKLPKKTNGWVQARISEPKGARILGLSEQNTDPSWNSVQYGLYIRENGTIQILEKGKVVFTSKEKVEKGDIIKVERKEGVLHYKKNKEIVYSSKKTFHNALYVDIAMYTPETYLQAVKLNKGVTYVPKNSTVRTSQATPIKKDLPINFKKIHTTISIEHVTDADITALNQLKDKATLKIKLGREIGQEEFDTLCSKLTWIRRFDFGSSFEKIKNFGALENLVALERIYFSYLRRTADDPFDLQILKNAKNLEVIEATGMSFINANALQDMNQLKRVILNSGSIDGFGFLKGKSHITNLQIPNIMDAPNLYTIIGQLKSLEELYLMVSEKMVTSENLKELKTLKNLKWLFISGKVFSDNTLDIAPLEQMTALETLFVSDYNVPDLSPLTSCKNLVFVSVHKNTQKDQIDKLQAALPELEIKVSAH